MRESPIFQELHNSEKFQDWSTFRALVRYSYHVRVDYGPALTALNERDRVLGLLKQQKFYRGLACLTV